MCLDMTAAEYSMVGVSAAFSTALLAWFPVLYSSL